MKVHARDSLLALLELMEVVVMKLHVKYRLHILVYCMNILGYIYLPSAIKLGDYIIKNLKI